LTSAYFTDVALIDTAGQECVAGTAGHVAGAEAFVHPAVTIRQRAVAITRMSIRDLFMKTS